MATASSAVELIQAIDIVDEISKYVKLKPSKQELQGLCPFHTEDTPSFYVNPSKQLFYCFGCQEGGNVINFRSKMGGLTLQDALEALAKDYHIELSHKSPSKGYQDVLSLASKYYQSSLRQSSQAQSYLKDRGLESQTLDEFEIGYAPSGWNNLSNISGFPVQDALDIGLVLKSEKGTYDRFRHRVMFPIRSHQGHLVGFGGRALGDEKPKYINSSDSPAYHKGEILYGLYQALKTQEKHLIVVEGYMDVISLHQAGFKGAVAALGTAFTPEQFQLICKYADKVTFCFDGDTAGHKAAKKAFFTILPHLRDQLSCYFLMMASDDPDAYIQKHGKAAFSEALQKAKPLSDFLLEDMVSILGNSLEDKAKYVHAVREILNQMPHSILKNLLVKKVGGVPKLPPSMPKKPIVHPNMDVTLVGLIFGYPGLMRRNQAILSPLLPQLPKVAQEAMQSVWEDANINLAAFLVQKGLDPQAFSMVKLESESLASKEMSDLLRHYQLQAVDQKIQGFMSQKRDERSAQLLQELLKVKHLLKKKKIVLASNENT